MIQARDFVEAARERGFDWFAGVPCSFLTPFINCVLQDPSLRYVSMANEGDAVALIAGVALAGTPGGGHRRGIAMMQNSGLGNAVSPLTSLTWTFRLPRLLIVTWRGQPGVHDEPQHALMGPITPAMLDTMEIRWELFPTEVSGIGAALDRATAVLASTGFCGRELYAIEDRPNQLYMVGSMGCVVPLALGLALARPDLRVMALDGDGAALMRMGAFATVGAYGPPNLWHLLLDNGAHDSTGGQATVSPNVSFAEVATACGYADALDTDSLDRITAWLEQRPLDGARFARLLTRPGSPSDLPRPSITPVDVKTRLMQHFGPQAGAP